jgi:hypothetical protein
MKVAVFGSWPETGQNSEWKSYGEPDDFRAACREVGSALAERGHTLIVESDKENAADRYIVEGYVKRAAAGLQEKPLVELAWPRGLKRPFERLALTNPNLFRYHKLPTPEPKNPGWKSSHMRSLRLSEAVLTIGGMGGTYAAGSAAILAKRPLAPVASFGGASDRLLNDLMNEARSPDFETVASQLNSPWDLTVLNTAMKLLTATRETATMAVFVSHAHRDEPLARALVDLIEGYFDVPGGAIRCTSVPGYTLPPGVHISEALRSEIEKAEFVLALITPRGLESRYVLFELGAAWGLRGRAFPLLAHGLGPNDIPGPFSERNPLNLAQAEHCFALLEALEASRLMRK